MRLFLVIALALLSSGCFRLFDLWWSDNAAAQSDGGMDGEENSSVPDGSQDGVGDGGPDVDGNGGTCSDSAVHSDPSGALQWVCIPGGSFQMGTESGGESNERPVHEVTVPSFELLRTEVTVSQYDECVTDGACSPPTTGGLCNWPPDGQGDHPVNCIDWQQAVNFCNWAGGRLPSEAEWEYAARSGGQDIIYPWGDDTATCDFAVMDDATHTPGCDTDQTWPVCSKPFGNTSQGICDLAGNVWEWVQDWYHSDYTDAPNDGSAWEDPIGTFRSRRGGAFYAYAAGVRSRRRYEADPPLNNATVGVRCARSAP